MLKQVWVVPGSRIEGIVRKFQNALRGLQAAFQAEWSFRLQVGAAIAVGIAGFTVGLTRLEWVFLLLAVGLVLALELLNSMLEKTLDLLHPTEHALVRYIKDAAAAAVLIASLAALAIGILLFIPHLL